MQQENKDLKLCKRSIERLGFEMDMQSSWSIGMNPTQFKKYEEQRMQRVDAKLNQLEIEAFGGIELTQTEIDLLTQNFLQ